MYRDREMRSIFLLSRCQRNLILLFSRYITLCKTRKNTREFHLHYRDYVCKVNEWCLVDCFHHEFMFSTQIMVRYYCIAKYKKFSACGGLFIFFAIQNIYINSNPVSNVADLLFLKSGIFRKSSMSA